MLCVQGNLFHVGRSRWVMALLQQVGASGPTDQPLGGCPLRPRPEAVMYPAAGAVCRHLRRWQLRLASLASDFICGQVVLIDGGYSAV